MLTRRIVAFAAALPAALLVACSAPPSPAATAAPAAPAALIIALNGFLIWQTITGA